MFFAGRFSQIWNSSSGVRTVAIEQRKHLRVDDARAGGQPLHVAHAEARRRAERVGMVDVAFADDGDCLEAAVRMLRKARDDVAVVHPPAVLAGEVLPDVPAGQRRIGAEPIVTFREVVDVVDAEQKRIVGLPTATRVEPR